MTGEKMSTTEYLEGLPAETRAALEDVRATVKAVAPAAVEGFSYGLPGFKYRGRPLIHFGAWKDHCAVYALNSPRYERELAPFDTAKGTIRFRPDQPLPRPLLEALLRERIADIESRAHAPRR
jgi:uncharacterized protein YdhG (YjbR/CyaY superfamily)